MASLGAASSGPLPSLGSEEYGASKPSPVSHRSLPAFTPSPPSLSARFTHYPPSYSAQQAVAAAAADVASWTSYASTGETSLGSQYAVAPSAAAARRQPAAQAQSAVQHHLGSAANFPVSKSPALAPT